MRCRATSRPRLPPPERSGCQSASNGWKTARQAAAPTARALATATAANSAGWNRPVKCSSRAAACPHAWAGQPQWCVLETGFGLGLNFLVTWAAWKADPQRPRLLHFVSTEAYPASADDVLRSALTHPELIPFAEQLKRQLWGLLPGVHRLVFEGGQVLLTLCIGDAKAMLREPSFEADSVYLDGFSPQRNPDIWDVHTFKAVARCCRRGTRIATWTIARSVRDALAQCGFVVKKVPGTPPKRDNLQGEYQPAWEPKKSRHRARTKGRGALHRDWRRAGRRGRGGQPGAARLAGHGARRRRARRPPARRACRPACWRRMYRPTTACCRACRAAASGRCCSRPTALLKAAATGARPACWSIASSMRASCPPRGSPDRRWPMPRATGRSPATPAQLDAAACRPRPRRCGMCRRAGSSRRSLVQAWLASPGVTWRGNAAVSQLVAASRRMAGAR